MGPKTESENNMENETDLLEPTLIEETPKIPTKIQQRKK